MYNCISAISSWLISRSAMGGRPCCIARSRFPLSPHYIIIYLSTGLLDLRSPSLSFPCYTPCSRVMIIILNASLSFGRGFAHSRSCDVLFFSSSLVQVVPLHEKALELYPIPAKSSAALECNSIALDDGHRRRRRRRRRR